MNPELNSQQQALLASDIRPVAIALAIRWNYASQTHLLELLRLLQVKNARCVQFTAAEIKEALRLLAAGGLTEAMYGRPDKVRLVTAVRRRLYAEALADFSARTLRDALCAQVGDGNPFGHYWWTPADSSGIQAIVRIAAFCSSEDEFARLRENVSRARQWGEIFTEALMTGIEGGELSEMQPHVRRIVAFSALATVTDGAPNYLGLARWLAAQPLQGWLREMLAVRLYLAEWMLCGGHAQRMEQYLAGITGASADGMRAAQRVQAGDWAAGRDAFEAAIKARGAEIGAKKRVFPPSLVWRYPLALLALGDPKSLAAARKFCLGEAGTRNPDPVGWGLWAHVIGARLGETPLQPYTLQFSGGEWRGDLLGALWKLLLRAWAHAELPPMTDQKALESCVGEMVERLRGNDLGWLAGQAEAALAAIEGRQTTGFFVGGSQEKWRAVLSALSALGDEIGTAGATASESRLLWEVMIGKDGRVVQINPLEQKRGLRGWSKAKPVPLTRLAGNAKLAPWDAKVAQALRVSRHNKRDVHLDLGAAMLALIGHPGVVLPRDHELLVDVVSASPQVEVIRENKGGFTLRVSPDPLAQDPKAPGWFQDEASAREYETLRATVVLHDSAQRLRVIRFTPAQKRAAQLLATGIQVPEAAQGELQGALRALAGHFDVHSDEAAAARQVAAEARLRAELAPAGEGLLLRLVVAPLGEQGPRLMPGRGRARLAAAVSGESLGTERDLALEQRHLDALLAQIEWLDAPASQDTVCEWTVGDPEQALTMLETLSSHPAVIGLDWPRGKPVRVTTVEVKQLQVSVKSERDWLRVSGRVALDEGRVFELQALIAAAAQRSRFVALGDGAYLALSKSLRDKLQALAAVAEADKQGLRAPALGAAWLDETLEGSAAEFDKQFRQRIERLQAAHALRPAPPPALQAELREYQHEGYVWAMRLAAAGFGACLADDMGLGKTVQALGVLLARAAGGAALVVAPTSVCGNWLAEAARFAPSLRVVDYGEGERQGDDGRGSVIDSAGPGDVVVVSYTLMQQAGEQFAARAWHTVIADEAQAVKNALAKRSKALFEIPADFRLALSGTPVENRLAELWSIMRFCNPGLLGTQARFSERFASPIERNRDRDAQRLLRRLIAPFVLRRTKTQVLDDLPPRTELVLAVAHDADEAAHYEALRRHLVSEAEGLEQAPAGQARMHILAQLTKLRRAACDPRLVTPDLAYVGAKVRAFIELARELADNGHKALVFSQFVDFLALLRAPLDEAGIAYQYLDGATPAAERTRRVAAFQSGEGSLFLISLKAGGFGLNLTAADYVVITDPWWNPAAEDQAMGRAHRMGQQRPVTVYRLVAKGTLEERIVDLHHEKRALAEGVLSDEGEAATLPSVAELIDLMRG